MNNTRAPQYLRRTLSRLTLAAVMLSQFSNEASNSLAATLFPWAVSNTQARSGIVLLGIAILLFGLAILCRVLGSMRLRVQWLRWWWPACVLSMLAMMMAIAVPGAHLGVLAMALVVIAMAEPIIELGTSVLVPEHVMRSDVELTRFNAWMLTIGALTTCIVPWLAPALAHRLNASALIDVVLLLGLIGIICLLPLRPAQRQIAATDSAQPSASFNDSLILKNATRWLPLPLALLVAIEAVWLPARSVGSPEALSFQAAFVGSVALGAALGAVTAALAPNVSRWRMLSIGLPIIAAGVLVFALSHLSTAPLAAGAGLVGVWLGLIFPGIETALQQTSDDPLQRLKAMANFSAQIALRCALIVVGFAAIDIAAIGA